MPKLILLDLDNTVYPYDPAHAAASAHTHAWLAQQLSMPVAQIQAAYETGRKAIHQQLHGTASSHNRLLYYQLAIEHLGVSPFPLALQAYRLYWGKFYQCMQPFAGLHTALQQWRRAGMRICILTDLTADVQYPKIAALRLAPYLDALVTSEEVGIEKPNARMFEYALNKMGCAVGDALMLGDNYAKDICGARKLDISAGWKTPTGTPLPEPDKGVFCWDSFMQLTSILCTPKP